MSYFYLVLYDPATGAVTQNPPRIWAKWRQSFGAKDPLLKRPFISSADLFENHHQQIVFEEYVHNGNMYNGVVYHYFDVGPNLALTRVLARETRLLAFNPHDELIVRGLTQLSATRLRLDTFATWSRKSVPRKPLGYVILESPGPGTPFHVAQRHPEDAKTFDCLVTCMDASPGDDVFLREGNTFYY